MATLRYEPKYRPAGVDSDLLALATANPLEHAMRGVEAMGARAGAMAGARNAEEAVFAGEKPDFALPISPAAVAFNAAAEQAYGVQVETSIKAKVAELGSKYTGRNPSDPDSFGQLFDASAGEIMQAVPESMRGRVGLELQARRASAVGEITGRAQQYEFQRNVNLVEVGLKSDTEEAAVLARDGAGPEAVAALYGRLQGRVDQMVQAGVWSAEEGAIRLREHEGVIESESIFGNAVRSGNLDATYNALVRGEGPAEGLSLQQRDRLVGRLSQEIGHRNAQANHAIALQGKAISQGDRDLNALTRKMDLGVPLAPDEQQRLAGYNAGQLAASPVQLEEARASARAFGFTRTVATMTPVQVEQLRASLNTAQPPASIEEALYRQKVSAGIEYRDKAVAEDPAAYLAESDPEHFPPIALPDFVGNPAMIGTPEFEGAMQALSDRAALMKAKVGGEPSPLTKEQSEALATALASPNLSGQAKADLAASIDRNFGDQKWPILHAVAKNGAPAFAHAGWLTGINAKDAALKVSNGDALLKNPEFRTTVEAAIKLDKNWQPAFTNIYKTFPTSPAMSETLTAAIRSAYATEFAKGNSAPDVEEIAKKVGAQVAVYGPRKDSILLPFGVTDVGEFGDRIESVDPEKDPAVRNAPPEVIAALRDRTAQITSLGGGQYKVEVGAGGALPDGKPFVLDYNGITKKPVVVDSRSAAYAAGTNSLGVVGRAVGSGVDAVIETTRAVVHNTVDPLADLATRASQAGVPPTPSGR